MFIGDGEIRPFKSKVWLSSPTMHGEELKYMTKAYETNWMSTVGENINEVEAHLYGTLGKIDEIKDICEQNHAVIMEDAAESPGASYKGVQTETSGLYSAISLNGNNVFETEVEKNDCKESTKMAARKGDMKPYFCIEVPMKSYIKVICTKHRWYGYLQAEMSNT